MKINKADVAELVDARDLKSLGPIDDARDSIKTIVLEPTEFGADPEVLQNNPECFGAMSALQVKVEAQQAHAFFDDPIDVRRDLIAKRLQAGANTPYGHACSNIVEILDGWLAYTRQPWATRPEQTLAGMMNLQLARLARLSGGAH